MNAKTYTRPARVVTGPHTAAALKADAIRRYCAGALTLSACARLFRANPDWRSA